ncbi:MAG: hypothetical protein ACREYF_05325, partial [Gammaproteobacteria bacterium]
CTVLMLTMMPQPGRGGVILYYGRSAPAHERATRSRDNARVMVGVGVLLCGVAAAWTSRWLVLSQPEGISVPVGGWLAASDGWGRFYLERTAGWYQSWHPGPYRGAYYILGSWVAVCLMAALAALFCGFRAGRGHHCVNAWHSLPASSDS